MADPAAAADTAHAVNVEAVKHTVYRAKAPTMRRQSGDQGYGAVCRGGLGVGVLGPPRRSHQRRTRGVGLDAGPLDRAARAERQLGSGALGLVGRLVHWIHAHRPVTRISSELQSDQSTELEMSAP